VNGLAKCWNLRLSLKLFIEKNRTEALVSNKSYTHMLRKFLKFKVIGPYTSIFIYHTCSNARKNYNDNTTNKICIAPYFSNFR